MAFTPLRQTYPTIRIEQKTKPSPLEYLAPLEQAYAVGKKSDLEQQMFKHKLASAAQQREDALADRQALRDYHSSLLPTMAPIQDGMGFPNMQRSDATVGADALNALLGTHSDPYKALQFSKLLQGSSSQGMSPKVAAQIGLINARKESVEAKMRAAEKAKADKTNILISNIMANAMKALRKDPRVASYDPPGVNWPWNDLAGEEALAAYGLTAENPAFRNFKQKQLQDFIRKEISVPGYLRESVKDNTLAEIMKYFMGADKPFAFPKDTPSEMARGTQESLEGELRNKHPIQ